MTGHMVIYVQQLGLFDADRNYRMVRTCFKEIRILSNCTVKLTLTFIPREATLDIDRVAETSFAIASLEHKYKNIHGFLIIVL